MNDSVSPSRAGVSGPGFWRRWVAANAAAEVIGLGSTAFVFALVGETIGDEAPAAGTILATLIVVSAATILEGGILGLLQWRVLRLSLPELSWRIWATATAAGALTAWMMGMLPDTIFSLLEEPAVNGGGEVAVEPAPETGPDPLGGLIYLFTTIMGVGAGTIFSFFQWLVLRRYVLKAGWWVPANALAWAAGMALIFFGIDQVIRQESIAVKVVLTVLTLAAAGALVGAIHGLVLVELLKKRRP